MSLCDCLIHPFQKDPGTSQRQRVIDELVNNSVRIDARTLSDLLDYFVQLSRHINYYDKSLQIYDWQPFFKNSLPFVLSSVIRYPAKELDNNFTLYNSLFNQRPSYVGLQLNTYFLYYRFIAKINEWTSLITNSGLPIENIQNSLIKNKLSVPVKSFIQYVNAGVKDYGIRRIDFRPLLNNPAWNLDLTDLYAIDTSYLDGALNAADALVQLNNKITALYPVFPEILKLLSAQAELDIDQSLLPLKETLQKNHTPHLALLFAFLNIFQQLQNDLNGYTQKHLDFFYREVLLFKPADAIPDKAHVVFEIQNQLEKYLIKKGINLKDGKDNNKQDILFASDEDLVVTKTTLNEEKTLFVNYNKSFTQRWVEGVYIAPAANAADGIDKSFHDGQPTSFSTLGSKYSKYIDPKSKLLRTFPHGRLGFVMGSNVLYLKEGNRFINIQIACIIKDTGPGFVAASDLFSDVSAGIFKKYIILNNDIFNKALELGFDNSLIKNIRDAFMIIPTLEVGCYGTKKDYRDEYFVEQNDWDLFITNQIITNQITANQKIILDTIFPQKAVLDICFSGEKDWLVPDDVKLIMSPLNIINPGPNEIKWFVLTIEAQFNPGRPAITSYNKDNLGEDFGTALPLAKVTLNDSIKLFRKVSKNIGTQPGCCVQNDNCCLLNDEEEVEHLISYYHFFRDTEVTEKGGSNPNDHSDETNIEVTVCGLKNFIVQNDESLMDVNGQVYPFGSRPKINADFYIGSEEVLLKHWTNIFIHLSWKDLPADFKKYYEAYQSHLLGIPPQNIVLEENFKIQLSVLQDGQWIPWKHCLGVNGLIDCLAIDLKCRLFQKSSPTGLSCVDTSGLTHQFSIDRNNDFIGGPFPDPLEPEVFSGTTRLDVNSRCGFLKFTLQCQDFQHEIYPFILARQMLAMSKLPNEPLDDAVYYLPGATSPIVFDSNEIKNILIASQNLVLRVDDGVNGVNSGNGIANNVGVLGDILIPHADRIRQILNPLPGDHLKQDVTNLTNDIVNVNTKIANIFKFEAIIPNEPWTPIISALSIDYRAIATVKEVQLVHLYPFEKTSKSEQISFHPTLFPSFYDEGTLFLGLKNLIPGDGLSVLFQLAEATSNSESNPEDVIWQYLDNNIWKLLRSGTEIVEDQTRNLTTSGIIRFSIPENISLSNTIMEGDEYWIKAAVPVNSTSVSETIGIHFHAVRSTFTNDIENDKLRLAVALPAGSISRLNDADASVKSVLQPYDSFQGRLPEDQGQFYVRVSETLRHKNKAIQAFDYERIILEAFPLVFKVKCINHSFALDAGQYINDYPMAPGYVTVAVIPDLNKLIAGNSNEPKVPVSMLEDIETLIRYHTSPFVRVRAVNPRYEKIHICVQVRLIKGKDESFFREKLIIDILSFLEPWSIGQFDKLTFGQCVYKADIIQFIENLDYIDFISDIKMSRDGENITTDVSRLCPETPRSILTAGNIEVNIDEPDCVDWETRDKCSNKPEIIINYCK